MESNQITGKNYNEKLNLILTHLRFYITQAVKISDIENGYRNKRTDISVIIESLEFQLLFDKLVKDTYAKYDTFSKDHLSITADGVLFIDKGGYTTQADEVKNTTLREKWVAIVLFVFSFFGCIAAVLNICEKISSCCSCHH